jgi:hypothetical protein
MEADLDKTEIIKANPNELFGENLLLTNYALNREHSKSFKQQRSITGNSIEPTVLSRPTTPHQLRQSIQLNNTLKSINSKEKIVVESVNFEKIPKTSIKSQYNETSLIKGGKQMNNLKENTIINAKSIAQNSTSINKTTQNKMKASANFRKTSSSDSKVINDNNFERTKSKLDSVQLIGIDQTSLNNNNNNYKIQNSVDSYQQNKQQSSFTLNSVNAASSIIPKFSSFEPRPSSANSSKSRNSSSSGTATFSEHASKKENSKIL